ncbi:MAG: glycosyltransferase family 2 protein [Chlamydiota bacterium]
MKTPKVYILLLHWNGYDDTLRCLLSLKNLRYPSYEVLVIDNGSSDDSLSKLQRIFPDYRYISLGKNLGYAGGNNRGIDYALKENADYLFLLNNDTTVEKDTLCRLIEGAKRHPNGRAFGPKVLQMFAPNTLDYLGGVWDETTCNYVPFGYKEPQSFFQKDVSLDYISGCSLLLDASIFPTIDKLDERFFLLWEEADLCARIKKQGHELWAIPESVIYHKGSSSFSGKAHLEYYWHRNRLLWMEKHVPRKNRPKAIKRFLRKELIKPFRHYLIKRLLWAICPLYAPSKRTEKKRAQLSRLYAACLGMTHYYCRRFSKRP